MKYLLKWQQCLANCLLYDRPTPTLGLHLYTIAKNSDSQPFLSLEPVLIKKLTNHFAIIINPHKSRYPIFTYLLNKLQFLKNFYQKFILFQVASVE